MIPCVQLWTGLSFLHAALYIALQEPVIQNQRSQATLILLYMITVFIEEKEEGFMRYFPELEHFKNKYWKHCVKHARLHNVFL